MTRPTRTFRILHHRLSLIAQRYTELAATRDTSAAAATLTFYGAIALVPLLLLSLRCGAFITSSEWVVARGNDVALLLPDTLGARNFVTKLVDAGVGLSFLHIVLSIFPATFYGEGLRRSLPSRSSSKSKFDGWRGRLALVPVAALAPFLLIAVLASAEWLTENTTHGGAGELVLRVWVGFIVVWLVLGILVLGAFAFVASEPIPRVLVVWCSAATASFLAGFVQGFVLFLAIPVSLGAPFGGLTSVGVVVALGLWLWVLHVILIVGWGVTQATAAALALSESDGVVRPPEAERAR